jgi:hypothetical protein
VEICTFRLSWRFRETYARAALTCYSNGLGS